MWHGYFIALTKLNKLLKINTDEFVRYLQNSNLFHRNTQIIVVSVPLDSNIEIIHYIYELLRRFIPVLAYLVVVPRNDSQALSALRDNHSECTSECSYCGLQGNVTAHYFVTEWLRCLNPVAWQEIMESQLKNLKAVSIDEELFLKPFDLQSNKKINLKDGLSVVNAVSDMKKKFHNIALGGTFDGLHEGHLLLLFALLQSLELNSGSRCTVSIGLMPDTVFESKEHGINLGYGYISRYRILNQVVHQLLTDLSYAIDCSGDIYRKPGSNDIKLSIRQLDANGHGFAESDAALEALVVSSESAPNVESINFARKHNGLKKLIVLVVPLVKYCKGAQIEDLSNKISSSAVRSMLAAGNVNLISLLKKLKNSRDAQTNEHFSELIRSVILRYFDLNGNLDISIDDAGTIMHLNQLYKSVNNHQVSSDNAS